MKDHLALEKTLLSSCYDQRSSIKFWTDSFLLFFVLTLFVYMCISVKYSPFALLQMKSDFFQLPKSLYMN